MPSLISVVGDELLSEIDEHFRVLGTYLEVGGLRTREVFSRILMLVDLLVSLGVGIRSLSRVELLMWRVPFIPSFVRPRQMSNFQSVFCTIQLGIGGARSPSSLTNLVPDATIDHHLHSQIWFLAPPPVTISVHRFSARQ
ncbi:unnamed protein product [Lactuca saligna]|uniref:Uncharacterized protein n=1 Tax=Lactuca saligna TaxID=75948 RepID=A0AA35VKT0_LACSI|nr:unnamed protein product [Lactuca saligna]